MKKLIALFLALIMVLSLFAGCAKKEETPAVEEQAPATEETTATETPAEEAPAADWQEEHPTWLCEEKTTLTVMTYDRVNNTYLLPDDPNNRFFAWLEDYTNVHIEWEVLPMASYSEAVNTKLGAGNIDDLADILNVQSALTAKNGGQSGMFWDMAPYWEECFPNVDKYFKETVGTAYPAMYTDENGSIWSMAGVNEPVYGRVNFLYNTAWLEAAGLEVPSTLDEFTNLFYTWQEMGDLNGNGKDDEILLTSSGLTHTFDIIGSAFAIEQYEGWDPVVALDGKTVECEAINDNWRACLAYCNQLFNDGIIDPEIASMSMDLLSEKVAADRVGCFIFYGNFIVTYGALTPAGQADPLGEHYSLGLPLGSEWNGGTGWFCRRIPIGGDNTVVNAKLDEETAKLAMKWLDVMLADPTVLDVRQFGFEGETFHYEDGVLINDNAVAAEPFDIQKWGCGQIALPHYQTPDSMMLKSMAITYPWYGEQYASMLETNPMITQSVVRSAFNTPDEQDLLDMVGTEVNSYYREMRIKFITGEADVNDDAQWQTYIDTLYDLGLDTYLEAYQMIHERTSAAG